jgi:alpha,alpha-trehalase
MYILKHRRLAYQVPYPPIEQLGVVGDRRTAALIAPDGVVCWMCYPNYDGNAVFASLLDVRRGGSWKFGPRAARFGCQSYLPDTFILKTVWSSGGNTLELLDTMILPDDLREPAEVERRVLLRRLTCTSGEVECCLTCQPRVDFRRAARVFAAEDGIHLFGADLDLAMWSSIGLHDSRAGYVQASFRLSAGQEAWCAFGRREDMVGWSTEAASNALSTTIRYWQDWPSKIRTSGPWRDRITRAALLVHLLTFAPTGAVVASPSASLPERIGGQRNYDYRFTWIRDASLSVDLHSRVGSTADAKRFLDWLCHLSAQGEAPLQALYRITGELHTPVTKRHDLYGYRGSRPIRFGNPAASSRELDSFGYLADCMLTYLEHGGEWCPEYWDLISRIADFTASNWHQSGASIWEISPNHHFVVTKVMAWVTLDRVLKIANRISRADDRIGGWRRVREEIHADVMERGWRDTLGSFTQRYEADTLDSSLLLIPIVGFLSAHDPKVTSMIARIRERLEINGLLHRFVPSEVPGQGHLVVGEEEGAFLMCTLWLARLYAMRGDLREAEALVARVESLAGPLGLFAEGADARSGSFLGNMPLLFSQVAYAKAIMAIAEAEERFNQQVSGT